MLDDPSDEEQPEALPDVRAPSPLDRLVRWLGPPADYRLTRWMILRLLGCWFPGDPDP